MAVEMVIDHWNLPPVAVRDRPKAAVEHHATVAGCLFRNLTYSIFQIADLVELNDL